jgi:hypothetical protein
MLDCARDDVRSRLSQLVVTDVDGLAVNFSATDPRDLSAVNTAAELEAIHSTRSFWGRQIRSELGRRYVDVNRAYAELVQLLRKFSGDWEEAAVRIQQARVKAMLSRHSPYAGLIRSKMRELVLPTWHPLLGL